ncbi:DUF4183 domain-containing protein [Paenibacillus sp. RRE4]|uniref:DUF4183 domain-containing protein n=1 Tax=Paenibacillus sp. RRE4 TaxID=2962587 RepID=UPI00288198CE|nr:DUF4183 domain-containing protein [Paenibacillus sp. RRE4]MDT0121074.1 DUF4183 domain-containing protein [Paenibacillus sp. RRE4]
MKHTNKVKTTLHSLRKRHPSVKRCNNIPRKRKKRYAIRKALGRTKCACKQRVRQKKVSRRYRNIAVPERGNVPLACPEPTLDSVPVKIEEIKTVSLPETQGLIVQKGSQGLAGPRGEQGEAGSSGVQGVAGLRGERGEPGSPGAQGPVGPQGVAGEQGPSGVQGPAGPRGEQGEPGSTGAQGPVGPQGVAGEQGPPGVQGPTGPPGEQGPPGSIPGIQIIPTSDRYFYFPDTDLDLSNSVTVAAGEFVNDEGGSISQFAGIGMTSYYNLYINGIVQPGNSYVLTTDSLFIPSQSGVLFAETPVIIEIVQLTAIILNL